MYMGSEVRTGAFHIVTPLNDGMKRDMTARIARQAGVPPRAVNHREIDLLRRMFDGGVDVDPFSSHVHSKYIRGRISETEQQLAQSLEVIFAQEPRTSSYGVYMPSYLIGLRGQKDRIGDHPHASLLIGALTTDTIREYVTTVRDVYP